MGGPEGGLGPWRVVALGHGPGRAAGSGRVGRFGFGVRGLAAGWLAAGWLVAGWLVAGWLAAGWLAGLLPHRLGASRAEDALGGADQLVGPVSHQLEPVEDLLDPILEPIGGVPLLTGPVRAGRTVVVPAHRPGRPGRARRAGRAVVPVVAGCLVGELAGQFLGLISGFLRLVGGLLGLVGLLLGAFGAAASLLGGGAGLVGSPLGLGDGLPVAPFVGQFQCFLGQVGGFLRPVGSLLGAVGALACLLGQVTCVLGQPTGMVGLLLGARLGLAVARVIGCAINRVDVPVLVAEVFSGVVLVLHRMPGHAVRLARLSHALAGGDLPGLVLSHDRFFPGEAARVCSPW